MNAQVRRIWPLIVGMAAVLVFGGQAVAIANDGDGSCCDSCCEDPCCGLANDEGAEKEFTEGDDRFLEGYLQALVDVTYHEYSVGVRVRQGRVYLSNLPTNCLLADSIITYIEDNPCVSCVEAVTECPDERPCSVCCPSDRQVKCIWFPQNTVLFTPLVADPRQVSYSVAYRFHDEGTADRAIAISFGDLFPLVRWLQVLPWCGDLQIDVEAGVWAVFDAEKESSPLLNNDYYMSFPISYALGRWAFRLRPWHLSSHLGDEFMDNNPDVDRLNVSREGIDLFVSYQLSCPVRLYGGIGMVVHEDKDFERERAYFEYGTELRLLDLCNCDSYCGLYGTPFLAMHFRHWRDPIDKNWDNNRTYALGYEWSKLSGVGRKLRLFAEYHEGFSLEGQFSRVEAEYFSVRLSYGF